VRGRQVCWSDPKLQALAKQFIPAADEVWRLQHRKDLDCLFFQGFSEEGHYGGRSQPTSTRQGIYCCSPSGTFLGSANTADPRRMERMLRAALARWKALPAKDRLLDYDPATRRDQIQRRAALFPEDGLALRVYSRDMPRPKVPDDWRRTAWNVDSFWVRKGEARTLLPARLMKGEALDWPAPIAARLVRHGLVDNVRGQTNGYRAQDVQLARLRTTVVSVRKALVTVRLEGTSRATTTGTWPAKGRYAGMEKHGPNSRGVQTRLVGTATFDQSSGRFTAFELLAVGTRWGQTRYNFRQGDLDESRIGFAVILDADDPGNRVAPAEIGAYGW
jgi:hypothetical protein